VENLVNAGKKNTRHNKNIGKWKRQHIYMHSMHERIDINVSIFT
jgi:hypothetical protein